MCTFTAAPGVIVDLLECGGRVIVDNRKCSTRSGETPRGRDSADRDPGHDIALDHLGAPINEDFNFTICAPPRPIGASNVVVWDERVVPHDTIDIRPLWEEKDATGACGTVGGSRQVQVTIRLGGTNVTPDSVYARKIYMGWVSSPVKLRHFRVTLDRFRLYEDNEDTAFVDDDCECAWFWSSVDRAPDEVIRLSDIANDPEHMNDMGDGEEVTLTNGRWDFLVRDGQPFTLRTFGFDGGVSEDSPDPTQDCLDDHFGHHDFGAHVDLETRIVKADVAQAIRQLQILRTFIDGCGATADHDDWIVDCPAQVKIRRLVDLLRDNLAT
jgi:hypothetical protein